MAIRRHFRALSWLLFALWCFGLTLLTYGSALRLPFFFDDFVHIPFVDAHGLAEIWQTAGRLAYYRPLPFTIWKVMYLVVGYHSPTLQHAFNLLLHVANGLMVGWLAGQLWAKTADDESRAATEWLRIYLSASLFLLFPFSYQAVPWVGSLAHLLVLALILLSIVSYYQMRRTDRKAWGALSLLFAFLAPFAHENGILIGPLLAAILFTRRDYRQKTGRYVRHVILWSIPALLWLPIWWLAPKAVSGSVNIGGAENLMQNAVYFLQGIAYPTTWLGGWTQRWTGIGDMTAVLTLGLLALVVAALVQWFGKADRRSLLPWLWCGIASLPAILFLKFDYVINGPRLLMLASVGAAWLWSDVLVRALFLAGITDRASARRYWPRTALLLASFTLILGQSYGFLRERMTLHDMLGTTHRQAVTLTNETNDANRSAIFVNLPSWLVPEMATYALGHEGVQFWPDYAPTETLVAINSGQAASLFLTRYEAIRQEMPYYYGLSGTVPDWPALAEEGGDVFMAHYSPDEVTLRPVGALSPSVPTGSPVASFQETDSQGQILLADVKAIRSEQVLEVTLTWQVEVPPLDQVTVFAHIVNGEGLLVGQSDGDPLGGSFPMSQWVPGMIGQDRRFVDVPEEELTVLVGLYNRLTGHRLEASSIGGEALPDDAVAIPVER